MIYQEFVSVIIITDAECFSSKQLYELNCVDSDTYMRKKDVLPFHSSTELIVKKWYIMVEILTWVQILEIFHTFFQKVSKCISQSESRDYT